MSNLWKKATSPTSVEDTARTILAKHYITDELRRAVRELQLSFIGKNIPICHGEEVESLCHSLEAIFIHGLKTKFSRKMTNLFNTSNSDRMPDPDFWPVVMVYSHKQVLSQISNLSNINSDVGRCRSWIRIALNDGLLKSYLDSLIMDKSTLNSYYIQNAYLSDPEQPYIMRTFIEGLEVFKFQLTYNSVYLNTWSPEPLLLSGIWNPPESPEPVMPAEDAVESLSKSYKKSGGKVKKSKKVAVQTQTGSVSKTRDLPIMSQTPCDGATTTSSSLSETISIESSTSLSSCPIDCESNSLDVETKSQNDIDDLGFGGSSDTYHQYGAMASSPQCAPGFDHMFVDVSDTTIIDSDTDPSKRRDSGSGNKLDDVKSSWSSCEINPEANSPDFDSQSYDSIFQSYARDKPAIHVLAATPELGTNYLKTKPVCLDFKSDMDSSSIGSSTTPPDFSPDLSDFEVIPKTFTLSSKDMDEKMQELLSIFLKICPERGLDSQNYKCHECGCQIGMIYGNPNLCTYDGYNYCKDCHQGDEYYVPSRVLYNWDFRKHPISKKAKEFLLLINEEPLIDIRKANPQLYTVVNELVEIQHLRGQLGFLRSYLFTCREEVADEFRKILWPREYLFEHIHSYSLYDLLLIPNGALTQSLSKAIAFGKKHVLKCVLCSQKGFICEVCSIPKIIYPFETDTTYHCEQCLGVYHRGCMNSSKPCPKCQRRRRRKESKDRDQ